MSQLNPSQRPEDVAWRAKWIGLDESHPDLIAMAEAARQFCARFFRNDRTGPTLLVLAGRQGTGKTHTAEGILRWASAMGPSLLECWHDRIPSKEHCEWSDLAGMDPSDPDGRWIDVCNADILALEDIGAEADRYRSGAPTENLRKILSARKRKFTVVTTNIGPKQWAERWNDNRIEDRLYRNSVIVTVRAPSYSKPKQARDQIAAVEVGA